MSFIGFQLIDCFGKNKTKKNKPNIVLFLSTFQFMDEGRRIKKNINLFIKNKNLWFDR